jgi:hypothetical protein
VLSDHEPKRPAVREQAPTCSKSNEEVAEIGHVLLTLAARSLSPPDRTATGYRLRLDPNADIETTLDEFVRRDKECCPFLELSAKRDQHVHQLDVRGPEAASGLFDLCVEFARLDQTPDLTVRAGCIRRG